MASSYRREGEDDPYRGFRFQVEIDGLLVAGFSEVTGLEMNMQPEEYQEGGVNDFTHQLPTRFSYSNLVLRKGVTDSEELWNWIRKAVDGPVERKSIRVFLLNQREELTWQWGFRGAYPVKWTGPELRADQGAVALETLELVHEGITKL